MTIDNSTAAVLVSVLAFALSVFNTFKNNKRTDTKAIEERAAENTRINMKLDSIMASMEEMKNERYTMQHKIEDHESRITKVEQSSSSAHHRLDGIENRLNSDKEKKT